ncbi:hypothetical protein ScPMuIL_007803 [Solemya velum]
MEDRLADNFQDGELEEAMDMSGDFNVNVSIEQHHEIQERSLREEVPSILPEERPLEWQAENTFLRFCIERAGSNMPTKRKRPSVSGEAQVEEHEESPAPQVPTKRRRKSPHYDPQRMCQEMYDIIRNYKTEEGRVLCETFIRAPKRRTSADYYEVVTTPIDLLKIQQKLKTEEYEEIDQMTSDMELLVTNAKAYYKKNSQEYKDANDLWSLYLETKTELINEALEETVAVEPKSFRDDEMEKDENSKASIDKHDDPEDLETVFAAVMTAQDGDRNISEPFQLLPPKSSYPEYYRVIRDPIDLKMIATRIQDGAYRTLDDLDRDLSLMVKNAKIFNEPKSLIYKDALTIKKIVLNKRQEIEQQRKPCNSGTKSSERIRKRERGSTQKLSAICAALKYQDDEAMEDFSMLDTSGQMEYEDESGGETTMSEEENPYWSLFNAIRNFRTPDGYTISEPFLKLPSRRFYPDYYEEIKKPMSLLNIRKRVKNRQYRNLEEMSADLNTLFENAKRYNADESKLYKVKILQKVFREKKKELDRLDKKLPKDAFDEDKSKSRKSMGPDSEKKKLPVKKSIPDEKKKLLTIFRTVYDYADINGRLLRGIFMELPSRTDYPDYFDVILNPVDLNLIENKIKNEKYSTEHALVSDLMLMFNNAKHYNEEHSQIHKDADTLVKVLKNKLKSMSQGTDTRTSIGKGKVKAKSLSPLTQKLQDLYDTIRDSQDAKNRILSSPFLKLPLKTEYPDYYEIIKKPIDMQRIQQKIMTNQYDGVDDMVADFVQMFDNACRYNEPDSLIYKDALTLQRLCLEQKSKFITDDSKNHAPDIHGILQEMMMNLFISTYNSQDEEGRCYSDSFAELPEMDPNLFSLLNRMPLSFDLIKKNLNKGRYRRLDRFQDDMFTVFDHARRVSSTDSQLYEDAVEMQSYFIRARDEVCRNGEILLTPALSYTERHLQNALELERQEKILREEGDKKKIGVDDKDDDQSSIGDDEGTEDSVRYKDQIYNVGDFIYVEPREADMEAHIMCIEKLYTDTAGIQMLHGNWYYRPNETYHLATRKFLEKEVFKSDFFTSLPINQIIRKCFVMYVKDYFKYRPENFPDKDVFVCESRYNQKHKCFKKIKIWQNTKIEHVKLVPREIPLIPIRVASVFADKVDNKDDLDDGETSILDKERENVPVEQSMPDDPNTYYEQLTCSTGCYKLGDAVYIQSEANNSFIVRIDKMWTNIEGVQYLYGPWFMQPTEVDHAPTRMFYKRELFLSCTEDTYSLTSILGKCAILHFKDYCSLRPTEIAETDIYICESKYHEPEKSIKRLGKGLKKYFLSPRVTDDEVYFMRKPLVPQKEPSPLLIKAAENIYDDVKFPPVAEPEAPVMSQPVVEVPEKPVKKAKSNIKRQISGYIVYSGEVRKQIQQENPDSSFGDISRIVGTKWRNLTKEEKEKYEERAKKIAEEQIAKQQEADKALNESLNRSQSPWSEQGNSMSPGPSGRPVTPGTSMPPLPPRGSPGMVMVPGQRPFMHQMYQQPGLRPYPALPTGQTPPRPLSGMPYPGMPPSPLPAASPCASHIAPPQPPRPPSPMFVSVPPRTQRLLHSEAYLRYIEGLTPESRNVSDWDKNLCATHENTTTPDESRLPSQWLAQEHYHSKLYKLSSGTQKEISTIYHSSELKRLHNRIISQRVNLSL